jgi:uncharacterized protein
MLQSLYRAGLFAVLFGLLFTPFAWGQTTRAHKVDDDAKLFSQGAVDAANSVIAQIKEKHHKDLVIETRTDGPKDEPAKWAAKRADTLGVDGVYIMISTNPKHFEVYVGNKTLEKNYFNQDDRSKVKKILSGKLGSKRDEALHDVVTYTRDTMDRHHPAKAQQVQARKEPVQAQHPVGHRDPGETNIPPWVGWVCMIVAVLFVVWIIFAIIRAMTGAMGGGGYGYGGGYGGGGGGFFTGMLGGLFGAMAGMWIYNNFFGGHAVMGSNGAVNWGGGSDGAAGSAPYEADTGGTSEGGDWGGKGDDAAEGAGKGDDGGGDWGGKGGDDGGGGGGGGWFGGGGGDAGGGGDWGGGGGGGGDWGGGGGGDWGGGGGGDFGGGGGGGDW